MVSADRESAAKRAEKAARIEEGISVVMRAVLVLGTFGYLTTLDNPVFQESHVLLGEAGIAVGLAGFSWVFHSIASKNTYRAQDLRNEDIPSKDRRAKLYKTSVHRLAHQLFSRRKG